MKAPAVISVGNLAMGGTGKTPFTVFLARHYMNQGEKVAILSLGYKGKLGYGTNIISDGKTVFHEPPYAADEPYMMASSLTNHNGSGAVVITGKDRTASYNLAIAQFSPTLFLLDDGFQHRKMRRDVDIVLLDHFNPLSTGFPFPLGYLREFPSALKRADIIVFTRASSATIPLKAEKYCKGKAVFFSNNKYMAFSTINNKLPLDYVAGKSVWLMSAIAGPAQFRNQIESLGATVTGHTIFQDHHFYTEKELKTIINNANSAETDILITTQKDYVKIPEQYKCKFIYPILSVNMLTDGLFQAIETKLHN